MLKINDAKALISQLREGRGSGVDINYLKTFDEEFSQHRQGIITLVEASTEYASSAVKGAEASSKKTVRLQLLGSGVSLFLLIIIGVWVHRTIFRSLGDEPHQVANIANAVASGDLTQHVEVRQGDNTSVMAAMQVMRERLMSIINIVNNSSLHISTRSGNIVNNSNALAARTEQQASALEQTAASMEQMTATVKQNADNAQVANQFADTASNSAEQDGRVMDLVVETMGGFHTRPVKFPISPASLTALLFKPIFWPLTQPLRLRVPRSGEWVCCRGWRSVKLFLTQRRNSQRDQKFD
ncbi:protein of unknown function [Enterobacter cancerogenus]|nr:protein of unknown function [Enterobacter cancerogenus]